MKRAILFVAFAAICGAQTTVNGGRDYKGTLKASGSVSAVDFSGAGGTAPAKAGDLASRPSACTQGQIYFATDVAAGQNLFFCTATGAPGVWTQMSGATTGPATAGTGAPSGNCTPPAMYVDTTNQDLWFCGAANSWKRPTADTSGLATLAGTNAWTGYSNLSAGQWRPPESTVANLPSAAGNAGKVFMVTDAATAGSCSTGGGTLRELCRANGSTYECVGGCGSGGGSGITTMTTGATDPVASCTAPSTSNLAVYTQTTTQDLWACVAPNTWKKVLSTTNTGTHTSTGAVGTAPPNPASGEVTCYYSSVSLTQICLDASGNAFTMVRADTGASNNFLTAISAAGVISKAQPSVANLSDTKTGSGSLVLATSPTLTTPTIGVATATSINKVAVTAPATSATLTIPDGVTLTGPPSSATVATLGLTNTFTGRQNATGAASTAPVKAGTSIPGTCTVGDVFFKSDATAGQNLYFCTATDTYTQQLNSGGGGYTGCTANGSNGITCTGAMTASQFIGDVTKSGGSYFQGVTSGGAAIAARDAAGTAITYYLPTTNGAAGQVLSDSGAVTCDANLPTGFPATCHLMVWEPSNGTGNLLRSAGTAAIASGKSLTVSNTLTFAGTDSTTMTFPSTSATVARTDAANTFTGVQTMTSAALTTPVITTDAHCATAGGCTLGTNALPASSVYIGNAATNNIQLTGTASASAKVATFPNVTGTVAVAATSTTATQALFATTTAGAPAYRAIASGDIPTLNQNTTGTAASQAADAQTLTNKTLDAEGTSNLITIPFTVWLPGAGCNNATAASFWDLPTSTPAVATCVSGTNTQKGVLAYADTTGGFSAQTEYLLPSDWTGAIDAKVLWNTAATSGNAKWSLSTICTATNATETDDAAFNTASTVTTAAPGTALRLQTSAITTLTVTGCAAGEFLHLKLFRDGNDAADTIAATANAIGVELKIRRAM